MTFQTPQLPLSELLKDIQTGRLQLPDFQREYKWDDDRIRSLLATVTLGHPMGVLMVLDTGSEVIRFKPRPITGASPDDGVEPNQLLLDGQQRMTSLYQALASGQPVSTLDARKKQLRRWYYLDIALTLGNPGDRDEAIASVPEDRILRSDFGRHVDLDLSTEDLERQAGMFPFRLAFDLPGAMAWLNKYFLVDGQVDVDRLGLQQRFVTEVLTPMSAYLIPAIQLGKDTTKEAVTTVFEKVNTGGLALNVFELLTATFAGDANYYAAHGTDFRLNDSWVEVKTVLSKQPALKGVENTDFLQAVTLLTTRARREAALAENKPPPAISARRADVLKLSLDDYLAWAPKAQEGFLWAAGFLRQEHVFADRDVPYRTQLIPLAVLRAVMGDAIDTHAVYANVARWYWCGVLGELYGGSVETRFARDVEQVPSWATGQADALPDTVVRAGLRESRFLSLKTRNSSAYKGMHALLMRDGAEDWIKHQDISMATFDELDIDIHHVFPYVWCNANSIDGDRRDSIVNKTPLAASTNRWIGGRAPSKYMPRLDEKAGLTAAELDHIVGAHHIDPKLLRVDDFESFFQDRLNRLVVLAEAAMGNKVERDVSEQPTPDDDRPESYEAEADDTGDATSDVASED